MADKALLQAVDVRDMHLDHLVCHALQCQLVAVAESWLLANDIFLSRLVMFVCTMAQAELLSHFETQRNGFQIPQV